MTGEEVAALIRTVPFKPLKIRVSDGRSFLLERLEYAGMTRDRKTLLLSVDPSDLNNYQTFESVQVDQIAEIKKADAKRRPSRGRRKSA